MTAYDRDDLRALDRIAAALDALLEDAEKREANEKENILQRYYLLNRELDALEAAHPWLGEAHS